MFSVDNGLYFIETSALAAQNVNEAFTLIVTGTRANALRLLIHAHRRRRDLQRSSGRPGLCKSRTKQHDRTWDPTVGTDIGRNRRVQPQVLLVSKSPPVMHAQSFPSIRTTLDLV